MPASVLCKPKLVQQNIVLGQFNTPFSLHNIRHRGANTYIHSSYLVHQPSQQQQQLGVNSLDRLAIVMQSGKSFSGATETDKQRQKPFEMNSALANANLGDAAAEVTPLVNMSQHLQPLRQQLPSKKDKLRPHALQIIDPVTGKNILSDFNYEDKIRPHALQIIDPATGRNILHDLDADMNMAQNTSNDSRMICSSSTFTADKDSSLDSEIDGKPLTPSKPNKSEIKSGKALKLPEDSVHCVEVSNQQTGDSVEQKSKGKKQESVDQKTDAFTTTSVSFSCGHETQSQDLINPQVPQQEQLKGKTQEYILSLPCFAAMPIENAINRPDASTESPTGESATFDLLQSVKVVQLDENENFAFPQQKQINIPDCNEQQKTEEHKQNLNSIARETILSDCNENVTNKNDCDCENRNTVNENKISVRNDDKNVKIPGKTQKTISKSGKAESVTQKNQTNTIIIKEPTNITKNNDVNEAADKTPQIDENNETITEYKKSELSNQEIALESTGTLTKEKDVEINCNEGKRSPSNLSGRKQYTKQKLMQLRAAKASGLKPDIKHSLLACFVETKAVANKSGNLNCEKPIIHFSLTLNKDIKLNEAANAWRPTILTNSTDTEIDPQHEAQRENEELIRRVRGILNKLTPEKFEPLVEDLIRLKIDTMQKMETVMILVFEKAIDEPNFSVSYASLCQRLISEIKAHDEHEESGKKYNLAAFHRSILVKTEQEFTQNVTQSQAKEEKLKPIREKISNCTDANERAELEALLQEEDRKIRRRSGGTVRFIGELFNLSMVTGKIIHSCIEALLKQPNNEDMLDCLCRLLTTVGQKFEQTNIPKTDHCKFSLERAITRMQNIAADNGNFKVSSRIRFMLLDVIDLRKKNWQSKRHETPKTMEQIEKEAKNEIMSTSHYCDGGISNRRNDYGARNADRNSVKRILNNVAPKR